MNNEIKAKALAKLLGVSPYVLRKWEKELDLSIPRNDRGHRVYNQEWQTFFQAIKQLVGKEISWDEIKASLRAPNQPRPEPKVEYAEVEFVY